MAYKTKFRKVKFPESGEELDAIGHDANSLRSMGAVIYRHNAEIHSEAGLPKALRVIFGGTKYVTESIGISDNKDLLYIVQGARKAAKNAGDAQGVEYLSNLLVELRDKAYLSEREKGGPYQMVSLCDIDPMTLEAKAFKKLKSKH